MTPEQKSKTAKSARRRGKRAEYLLRDHLRRIGWTADRVPTSGAAQGFKGDVKACKDGRTVLFECKNYSDKFRFFWDLITEHQRTTQNDLLSVAVPNGGRLCCDISTSVTAIFDPDVLYTLTYNQPLYAKYKSTFDRLETMSKMVKDADVLVLKDNFKPFLFLRFR